MFTSLTLSLVLGAPVPTPAAPVAAGTAPRVMELKANADGKVVVTVTRAEKVQVGGGAAIAPPGGAAPAVIVREVIATKSVELGEVKDLTATTADGKKLTVEEAVKKIGTGAVVVVSADGKPVSPVFLKVFKDDTVVLAAPELAGPQYPNAIRPVGPGGFRPLPPVQVLPINPGGVQVIPANGGGVIQIQIQPGGVQVLPAAPAQPAPEKKPVEK